MINNILIVDTILNILSPNTTQALQRVCFFMDKRPTIKDPAEWAIIREMYFDTSSPTKEDADPIEKWERIQSKHRNLNTNSR